MEEEKHIDETLFWEVPEIDLNVRHYAGSHSDVIKKLKTDIERYLSNPNLQENRLAVRYREDGSHYMTSYNIRKIYSAIYNALNYYKDISYLPSAEYGTGDTFLSNSIRTFNEDYDYLASKYNSPDPTVPPVIDFSARIKSPLSLVDKIREKVTEYIDQNRDFGYFNESLRDLIGVRVVVDPPKEIQEQGLQAECEFLYKVFYDLMKRRGITEKNQAPAATKFGKFSFIPVNTRHDPHKSEKLKSRPEKDGFANYIIDSEENFYIPNARIPEMEQPCVDSVVKDYIKYPKYKGYQSLHVCIIPFYSANVEHLEVPSCIIPSKCKDSVFEYQFRTAKQNDYAEHGPASHNLEYKPNGVYHRLAVPFYITFDSLEDLTEAAYDLTHLPKGPINAKNKLRLRNFGESFKKFYGFTFEEFFGIPFKKFRDTFESHDRDAILARKKQVIYDAEQKRYYAQSIEEYQNKVVLTLSQEEVELLRKLISGSSSPELVKFFETTHLMDGVKSSTSSNLEATTPIPTPFQLYQLETPTERENAPKVLTLKNTSNSERVSAQTVGKDFDDDRTN